MARTSSGIGGFLKRVFRRGQEPGDAPANEARPAESLPRTSPAIASVQRQSDIPMDVLDRMYTPLATSSKASFRSDGADHERDQELALGVINDQFNDEDRLTNKSGDPRIGTHNRNHTPAQSRPESNT